ncbi:MAG: glycerate kinase [Candidatus Promineifilaceae bacterium]
MAAFEQYREHVKTLFAAALAAADPFSAVNSYLRREGSLLYVGDSAFDLTGGKVYVVSVGKAALPMAEAAITVVGDALAAASIIYKKGSAAKPSGLSGDARIQVMAGNHPVSGEESAAATKTALAQLDQTQPGDLVLCLISGGASALLTQPVIGLPEWQRLINALLASGCTINELNTIRRRLDRVKGGGLARMAAPASCASLILSDVVGNPLEAIGSGPTILLEESTAEAVALLDRYGIGEAVGVESGRLIRESLQSQQLGGAVPPRNEVVIIGDVRRAAEAAATAAEKIGFVTRILTVHLEGEAREVGRVASAIAKDAPSGSCLILGGESTVTIQGDGLGGRNLETALAASIALEGWPFTALASLATDGEDGPTDAAGAVVAGWTAGTARDLELDPTVFLERNDSYNFFQQLDDKTQPIASDGSASYPLCLVKTGSTGTNVNDLVFILTYDH